MKHEEAQALLGEEIDGELDPALGPALAAHLEECAECREEREKLRSTLARLRHLSTPPPATDILSGVQAKIRKRSRGRYFRRGYSVAPRAPYEIIALLMLLVLLVIYLGMVSFQDLGPVSGGAAPSTATKATEQP